ncbi:OLC1v1001354C1 [Oldenlandia corymbosa var. corymbosa]|uniref:OLC1v1001354C1 n=1 Tax=Oldenlandia corymbosa var. corymbosa TaxID=529605 RepID=A0AAV1D5A8_OLDCO|nr:OLC1v1001354C1 [Oldenlandia corymbosa var. corymbosa]
MLSLPTLAPITVRCPPYYHKNHIQHQIHYVEPPKENNIISCRTTIFTKIELPLNKKKIIAEFFKFCEFGGWHHSARHRRQQPLPLHQPAPPRGALQDQLQTPRRHRQIQPLRQVYRCSYWRTLRGVPLRLESKSFLEKMTVIEHTVTFFLPICEAKNEYLSSNALVHLIKELYGNQIKELYNSVPHHTWLNLSLMITIDVASFLRKVTLSLRYDDLVSILPTAICVLTWLKQSDSLTTTMVMCRRSTNKFIPERISYAEDALEIMSLPEDEPDVSWVNYFVKEVPSENAGQLFSLEQKRNGAFNDIMTSWIDQLYIEQDR